MTKEDIKILLVDDEKQFVDTLSERLAMRGFEARVAYDGPEALKAVEQPTDVIVLDLRMPGMDGFEVLRNVKKSNPQVQVIILTGHGGDAEEQTAYRMGAYNFLRKPMDIDELLNSIRMAYRDKLENAMVAVSLAEGGDFDSARDVMNEKDVLEEHGKSALVQLWPGGPDGAHPACGKGVSARNALAGICPNSLP